MGCHHDNMEVCQILPLFILKETSRLRQQAQWRGEWFILTPRSLSVILHSEPWVMCNGVVSHGTTWRLQVGYCQWHLRNSAESRAKPELTRGCKCTASTSTMSLAVNEHFILGDHRSNWAKYFTIPCHMPSRDSLGTIIWFWLLSVPDRKQSHECLWQRASKSEGWALFEYLIAKAGLEMEQNKSS